MTGGDYKDFLERVRELLGPAAPAVGGSEANAILELARVAAHSSERKAAPISAYLAGLALAATPADAREARIDELVAMLERGDGGTEG